jgi:OmpA-OmpF porin, OOP family
MKDVKFATLSILLVGALSLQGCALWNRLWSNETSKQAEASKPATETTAATDSSESPTAATSPAPQEPVSATPPPTDTSAAPSDTLAPIAEAPPPDDTAAAEAPSAASIEPEPIAEMSLGGDALFAFGKSDENSITPEGREQLDQLVSNLMRMKDAIDSVLVIGYADRLGSVQRNLRLSERRAEAVKSYLSAQGIDAALIQTEGRGSEDAVVECPGSKATQALIQCLAPNRRVEVIAQARK